MHLYQNYGSCGQFNQIYGFDNKTKEKTYQMWFGYEVFR